MQADSRQLYARSDLPDGLLAPASGGSQVFKVVFECRRFSNRRCAPSRVKADHILGYTNGAYPPTTEYEEQDWRSSQSIVIYV